MRVVVAGDIARRGFYHLGDEAMTEVAVQLLRERGVDDIVLVARDPSLATELYGCPAVGRLTFEKAWSRERADKELARLEQVLAGERAPGESRAAVIDAVAGADALLIAGGGNLRSEHRYMIYERLALVRVARRFGKPVFVTSQTVGPMLEKPDEELVREIIAAATCFGVREPVSEQLVRRLAPEPSRVVLTMDDSVLLAPGPDDVAAVAGLGLPERYVVGSFTYHAGSTGMSRDAYQKFLARNLAKVGAATSADVLLLPHVGDFDPEHVSADRASDAAIVAAAPDGPLRALPLLPARQAVAVIAGAQLSVSTRYHSTVFATSHGVPSIALLTSYYSSVRMSGSLGNVGLGHYAMPADSWSRPVLLEAVAEATDAGGGLRRHLGGVVEQRRAEQQAWWDAMVAAILGEAWTAPARLTPVPDYPSGPWRQRVLDARRFADGQWRCRVELTRARNELKATRAELEAAESGLARLKTVQRNRPAARLARLARKLRPKR